MIYFIPLLLCLIGMILYDNAEKKSKGNFLWGLLFVILVSIIGLRYKVGGDTYNYMAFFEYSPDIYDWSFFDLSAFEPGFRLITSLIKTFFDDIYIYQTILSFLMTFMLMRFIRKNTTYKFLAMLLVYIAMYLYFSTEIIRESLAVTGFLTVYSFWRKKKYLWYYMIVLLLCTLHYSAIICFLIPFANRLKINLTFFLVLFVFVGFSFALFPIVKYLSGFFVFEKLLRYDNLINVGYGWKGFRFIYFSLLPLYVLNMYHNRFKLESKFESIICLQIIFGVGLWIIPVIFQRLINYTIIFYLVSLAEMTGTILRDTNWERKISGPDLHIQRIMARGLLVLTILAHSTYYIHLDFYKLWVPYHSCFDEIEYADREQFVPGG